MQAAYLYFAILFFSLLTLVLVIVMLMVVLNKKNKDHNRNQVAAQMEEWIMDIVLANIHDPNHVFHLPNEIEILLQSSLARRVLLGELMQLKKSLSGISGNNIEKLYNQLNLQEISLQGIADKHWHIKVKGIQELAIMNQHLYHEKIFELAHHQHNMVRMEAQTAMVKLKGYTGLQFFENLSYPLTEWHQLNLLFLLGKQPLTAEDGIYNWLSSTNASVVQFSLKLIGEQHATEFYEDVLKCLSHSSEIVRREAILCLGQMPSNAAAVELSSHFIIETDKNLRLCIIHEFIKTGSEQDLPFLQTLQHAEDVDIKLAADKTVLYLQKIS